MLFTTEPTSEIRITFSFLVSSVFPGINNCLSPHFLSFLFFFATHSQICQYPSVLFSKWPGVAEEGN